MAGVFHLLERLARQRDQGRAVTADQAARLGAALWPRAAELDQAVAALADPCLALGMLHRVLVEGFRGNPGNRRPRDRDDPRLARDLLDFLRLFGRIRRDLPAYVDLPPEGVAAASLHGDGGWCDLCGQCCVLGGTVPTSPAGVDYPAYWYHAIAGQSLYPQPFCPFLFQANDAPLFFCSIHAIKPLACARFDRADCRRGAPFRGPAEH